MMYKTVFLDKLDKELAMAIADEANKLDGEGYEVITFQLVNSNVQDDYDPTGTDTVVYAEKAIILAKKKAQ